MQKLTALTDRLVSSTLVAKSDDLPALAAVHTLLQSLRGEADRPESRAAVEAEAGGADRLGAVRDAARTTERLVESIILREVSDAEASMRQVESAVASLQQMINELMGAPEGQGATQKSVPPGQTQAAAAPAPTATAAPSPVTGGAAPAATGAGSSAGDQPHRIEEADLPLVFEFVAEAATHLESAEAGLLKLDEDPNDAESINAVFRGFHTIKGVAGFLNLKQIGSLAHAAETLLDLARKQKLSLTGGCLDIVLESSDAMKRLIAALDAAAKNNQPVPPDASLAALLERLERAIKDPQSVAASAAKKSSETETATETAAATPNTTNTASAASAASAPATATPVSAASGDGSVRVSTDRLDNLINMVGELVIAQSMANQDVLSAAGGDHRLTRSMQRLGKITRELQDLSMSMRMVPIQGVFQKMSRVVRDVSRKIGKQVDFSFTGGETELDRNVVEAIGDPLVHMVRNSVDHGIEPPDARIRAGKPPSGKVTLRAYHQAGNVVIEIADDGRGLNKGKILQKAIANGLVPAGQESQMSEQDVFKLIFAAGLSTADKVTDVSGRGVGMDVVRKNVEALRGRIETASVEGQGSTFTIRLPLTLAVIDGLIVRVGDQRYIIPILSVEQSIRPRAQELSTVQDRGEMCLIRGAVLPLFRLHKLFNVKPKHEDPTQALIVIVEEGGRRCCLMIDELVGQQQVVIKSLSESLGQLKGVSGGAILGDGSISLILDVPGLVQLAVKSETE